MRWIASILCAMVPYLLGSFVAFDLNAGNWMVEGRFWIGVCTILAFGFCAFHPNWRWRK